MPFRRRAPSSTPRRARCRRLRRCGADRRRGRPCMQLQVEAAVSREELQHVIEEADAGARSRSGLCRRWRARRGSASRWSGGRTSRVLIAPASPHMTDSSASIAASVCSSDAGGDSDAARAAGIAASGRGRGCRVRASASTNGGARFADPDEHEIGLARPVCEPQPLARGVELLRATRATWATYRGRNSRSVERRRQAASATR